MNYSTPGSPVFHYFPEFAQTHEHWVSDETWSTGEGNGKPLQYSCLKNPMNSMKGQKDMTPKDEPPPRWVDVQYATGEEQRNSSRKNEEAGQKQKQRQLWMCLVVKVKSNAVKSNIAWEPGILGPWIKVNWMWSGKGWQEWILTFLESVN